MAIRAIRGAIQVDRDDQDDILGAVAELVTEVLHRNGLDTDDLISILFTSHRRPARGVSRVRRTNGGNHRRAAAVCS